MYPGFHYSSMAGDAPLVVGIGGSIRNRASIDEVDGVDEEVGSTELAEKLTDLEHRDIYHDDFLGEIQPFVRELSQDGDSLITNSDALVLTALYGAKKAAEIEFHKLTEYVGRDRSYANSHEEFTDIGPLRSALERADGLVLGSPVYFGDRSSLMHSFLNFAADEGYLSEKVVGTVSVGSKRNGGQETANVYALFENLNHGALIVGNGPKTCQYGGTGWGGDIGDVADDDFGLETSLGTGLRVSQVARLKRTADALTPKKTADVLSEPLDVGVLVTRDKGGIVRSTVDDYVEDLSTDMVTFDVVDFSKTYIQACIGCDVCPTPAKVEAVSGAGDDYKCIIDEDLDADRWAEDDLQHLHDRFIDRDALIIAALDTGERGIDDMYQTLLERTRYVRRDDWRLHNVPLAAMVVKPPERSSTYPMKIMTSWMRHNTIIHEPMVHTLLDRGDELPVDNDDIDVLETHYNEKTHDSMRAFVESAKRLRAASQLNGPDRLSYKATGYRNKILDQTAAERT
jgi:multimeric flavodoxin WrbA